ncbi:unnamed protein product [Lepidochelys olivacea]
MRSLQLLQQTLLVTFLGQHLSLALQVTSNQQGSLAHVVSLPPQTQACTPIPEPAAGQTQGMREPPGHERAPSLQLPAIVFSSKQLSGLLSERAEANLPPTASLALCICCSSCGKAQPGATAQALTAGPPGAFALAALAGQDRDQGVPSARCWGFHHPRASCDSHSAFLCCATGLGPDKGLSCFPLVVG